MKKALEARKARMRGADYEELTDVIMPMTRGERETETISTSQTVSILPPVLECPVCAHREFSMVPIDCPKCYEVFIAKHVPKMILAPLPPEPPQPPAPKAVLPVPQRYATVVFEPINPRFKMIRLAGESLDSEERLWVKPGTTFKIREEIVVMPNPDTMTGGWVQVMPKRV